MDEKEMELNKMENQEPVMNRLKSDVEGRRISVQLRTVACKTSRNYLKSQERGFQNLKKRLNRELRFELNNKLQEIKKAKRVLYLAQKELAQGRLGLKTAEIKLKNYPNLSRYKILKKPAIAFEALEKGFK